MAEERIVRAIEHHRRKYRDEVPTRQFVERELHIKQQLWEKKVRQPVETLRSFIKQRVKSIEVNEQHLILTLHDQRRYYVDDADYYAITYNLLREGRDHELYETAIRELVQPGDTVLDLGANYGYYTILFSNVVGEKGQVHAFEPNQRTFTELSEHLSLNESENVSAYNVAVSNQAKEETLFFLDESRARASLRMQNEHADHVQSTRCVALDSFFKEADLKRLTCMKIDVEGAELLCIEGAQQTIRQHSPVLLLEVCEAHLLQFGASAHALLEKLSDWDYVFFEMVQGSIVQVEPGVVTQRSSMSDLVCIRQGTDRWKERLTRFARQT